MNRIMIFTDFVTIQHNTIISMLRLNAAFVTVPLDKSSVAAGRCGCELVGGLTQNGNSWWGFLGDCLYIQLVQTLNPYITHDSGPCWIGLTHSLRIICKIISIINFFIKT